MKQTVFLIVVTLLDYILGGIVGAYFWFQRHFGGKNRRKKCRNCLHFQEHYITSIHGQGIYKFGYCQREIYDCKLVEPDIERECGYFKGKGDLASLPDID